MIYPTHLRGAFITMANLSAKQNVNVQAESEARTLRRTHRIAHRTLLKTKIYLLSFLYGTSGESIMRVK